MRSLLSGFPDSSSVIICGHLWFTSDSDSVTYPTHSCPYVADRGSRN